MAAFSSSVSRGIIRWGIIGCGDVTEVKSGPGFQKARGSQLVAVMRRHSALAADYARRHGVPRWYDEAQSLVDDPEVDAVYVATPPGAHLEGVLLAAAAGKPVYVEKPMARHTPECDAMIAACSAAKQKLFVAYYRRALPRFLKVKELIDGQALGQVTSISYRQAMRLPVNADPAKGGWRLDVPTSGGGLLLDVGSHVLDLLDFFCGPLPLESVRAQAERLTRDSPAEDTVAMLFRTRDGVPGTATWNFVSHGREDMMEFSGTDGRVSFTVFGNEPLRLETKSGVEQFEFPAPVHIGQALIQTMVDDLLGRGTCLSTGESARRTTRVMDQVLTDYYGGREDEFWNRPETWPGLRSSS